jgi:hypothetical protein
MNENMLLEELIGLLEAHGIRVRREALESFPGGVCRMKGETVLFLDSVADPAELAALCAATAAQLLNLEALYLRPQLRQFIQKAAAARAEQDRS